ncbi:hypothetical protein KCTC32420_02753 [Aequorivita nionensis]
MCSGSVEVVVAFAFLILLFGLSFLSDQMVNVFPIPIYFLKEKKRKEKAFV